MFNRKCTSVSTVSGQNGQNRFSFGILVKRPTSIIKLWFDSLNFVICILAEVFLISERYCSYPIYFLNRAYDLSLLVSDLMDSKEL